MNALAFWRGLCLCFCGCLVVPRCNEYSPRFSFLVKVKRLPPAATALRKCNNMFNLNLKIMKKLLVVLFVIVSTFSTNAQEVQEHLKFKGIEITGNIDNFANSLVKQGYTTKSLGDKNSRVLSGKFANKDCNIILLGTPNTNTIWKVVVLFDQEYSSWYSLKSDYKNIKSSFVSKYGNPSNDFHFFSRPYEEGDGYEMTAIKVEKCTYCSFFDVKSGGITYGGITVEISKYCSIRVAYEDKIGSQIFSKEKSAIVSNDI